MSSIRNYPESLRIYVTTVFGCQETLSSLVLSLVMRRVFNLEHVKSYQVRKSTGVKI